MTPQELKASILQLAIQGKLVEQRTEEGTAEDLYQQIQAEKQRLIKAGTIKKEKSMSEITEDEILFDIPCSWMWVRLGTTITLLSGSDLTPDKYNAEHKGIPYITGASNIETAGLIINRWTEYANNIARNGDLLLTCKGTVGKTVILEEKQVHIARQIMAITPVLMDVEFLQIFIESQVDALKKKAKSMIPGIERENVLRLPFPLPPLAEQKRIVAKIEELLPYIDRYEQAWSRLEDFNRRFPVDMQKSILQMAIQGKLVEQRPEEGTGEELYQQIQQEKQRLIKAGTIKKEKPLPEITEDEIPFDIPEAWKWVRLRDIISVLGDGIHGTPQFDETGEFFFVNGNNLSKGRIAIKADTKRVSVAEYEKHKKPLDDNTILISINGTIGNYAFYNGEPIILGKSACYFSVLTGVDKDFIRHLLNTKYFMDYAVNEATQTTIKNVSLKAMRMLPVPLPPLAEQKRIVAKLEEILPLCDRLK
ncbi:MAG: restriction endonuclease [Clostridiales bacterium]|nr:restriction endonuclease [Clostridiales bacterium]